MKLFHFCTYDMIQIYTTRKQKEKMSLMLKITVEHNDFNLMFYCESIIYVRTVQYLCHRFDWLTKAKPTNMIHSV